MSADGRTTVDERAKLTHWRTSRVREIAVDGYHVVTYGEVRIAAELLKFFAKVAEKAPSFGSLNEKTEWSPWRPCGVVDAAPRRSQKGK